MVAHSFFGGNLCRTLAALGQLVFLAFSGSLPVECSNPACLSFGGHSMPFPLTFSRRGVCSFRFVDDPGVGDHSSRGPCCWAVLGQILITCDMASSQQLLRNRAKSSILANANDNSDTN